jgi:cob(I)alamin adenosyltransferase
MSGITRFGGKHTSNQKEIQNSVLTNINNSIFTLEKRIKIHETEVKNKFEKVESDFKDIESKIQTVKKELFDEYILIQNFDHEIEKVTDNIL